MLELHVEAGKVDEAEELDVIFPSGDKAAPTTHDPKVGGSNPPPQPTNLLNHHASASLLLVIVIKESGTGSVSVRSQLQEADARYGREIAIIREKAGAAGR